MTPIQAVSDREHQPSSALLWAKTGKGKAYHPLLNHMLDVAAVAGRLWDHHLGSGLRERLAHTLASANPRSLVMFLAGAHDIGKASPGFQGKSIELSKCIPLAMPEFNDPQPHGCITAYILHEYLASIQGARALGQITGGHHGIFPRSADLRFGTDAVGKPDWRMAQSELLDVLSRVLGHSAEASGNSSSPDDDPFLVPVLAGLISVADWIGSDQRLFPCAATCGETIATTGEAYWRLAQDRAKSALDALGWSPAVVFASEVPFEGVFPAYIANPLQQIVIRMVSERTTPYLMIIEAPTGSGKTEAALHAADLAMCRRFARGMYVAMPTQATGNAMFDRIMEDYLKDRGHKGRLNLQLVHGDALLVRSSKVQNGEIAGYRPTSIGQDDGDVEAQSWFAAKKRPLLAPFGVGTIDQSLLSVLQTKHWFVRLSGLAGKVIIFDEIHAYDDYTTAILERLLHWLAELDCTVILLSATLPDAKRRALSVAFSGRDDSQTERYPRVTLAEPRRYPIAISDDTPTCFRIPMEQPRGVLVEKLVTDLRALSENLTRSLRQGGCVAVICNTVNRSIEVFRHLRHSLAETECSLFHARTLRGWRREREAYVKRSFGKGEQQEGGTYVNPHRPHRAVLVATQVIEQSLDLDFDLMVSEIAPIDLLLQRMGRLHRHLRHRPEGLDVPRFVVLCDAEFAGEPPASFGDSIEFVYDRYVLLRTWMALRGRETIVIPQDVESLVEAVYGPEVDRPSSDWVIALSEARDEMDYSKAESRKAASDLLVRGPCAPDDLIEDFNPALVDDEDPEVHRALRAATRQGRPSVTVVFLSEEQALTPRPKVPEVRELLDRSVKLSHRGVFHALLNGGEQPKEWAGCAHLRHVRLVRLSRRSQTNIGDYAITVDRTLGVVIEKEVKDIE